MQTYTHLVFDLGGVLMNHNMSGCLAAFESLMGKEAMGHVLGLRSDGEGVAHSLMAAYECGNVKTSDFIEQIRIACISKTTPDQIIQAWNTMHGGIPQERLEYLQKLKEEGYKLYLLSNNNDLHWKDTLSHYPGIENLFEQCFLSYKMHCSKPDKEIFIQASIAIGSDPDRTVFIDDIEINRLSAENYVHWNTCGSLQDLYSFMSGSASIE